MVKILKKFGKKKNKDEKTEVIPEEENNELNSEATSLEEDSLTDEEESWYDEFEEGQLSVDVYETAKDIIVKSTIAGVKPEDIDISINNDMLSIRGKRETIEEIEEANYLYRECYWGAFSRSIILPEEVKSDKIDALLENGILTITLPKAKKSKEVNIKVKEKE